MYDYKVPEGFGDTFYQYVFDAQDENLTDGVDYQRRGIPVQNGAFISRFWTGLTDLADRITIYDWNRVARSSAPLFWGAASNAGFGQGVLIPEMEYPNNGEIMFDLVNVTQTLLGTDGALNVYASQLVFSGVRRRPGIVSDPIPSSYPYREVEFNYPFTLNIPNYATDGSGNFVAPVRQRIPITEVDFELRRIEVARSSIANLNPFKMQLYDTNMVKLSNRPVLNTLLCHADLKAYQAATNSRATYPYSFWPAPPVVYRVNSAIVFDVTSLLFAPTTLPFTIQLNFKGVRRIPC